MAEEGEHRRSQIVQLSVIGLVAAVVIGDKIIPRGVEMRRNFYADRAACERDYQPGQCEQTNPSSGGSVGYIGGYRGPSYAANPGQAPAGDPGLGRRTFSPSYETSYRGGFGAFGRAVHAVG